MSNHKLAKVQGDFSKAFVQCMACSPSSVGEVVPVLCSVYVALGSGGPEDGPHVLHFAFGVSTHRPGEWTPGNPGRQPEGISTSRKGCDSS